MSANPTKDIRTVELQRVVPAGTTRHGLVVGVQSYKDPRLNLKCARADAEAVYELMVSPECGMFPPQNVTLLVDEQATRENVWGALTDLRRSAGPGDMVWIYYSGHAAPDESNFCWVTYDSNVDNLYGTGLADEQISGALGKIRASRSPGAAGLLLCGRGFRQKHPTKSVLTDEEVFAQYQGKGRITLASSDGKEKSVELPDRGRGAFTWFLERGLRGEADADGEGIVTLDKLWKYLQHSVTRVSQEAGNLQTPVLRCEEMTHGLALTVNSVAAERKTKIEAKIKSLHGLESDELTTDEVRLCLEILRRGPQSRREELVEAEFDNLLEGRIPSSTFKALVQSSREPSSDQPEAPPPLPTPEPDSDEPVLPPPLPTPEPRSKKPAPAPPVRTPKPSSKQPAPPSPLPTPEASPDRPATLSPPPPQHRREEKKPQVRRKRIVLLQILGVLLVVCLVTIVVVNLIRLSFRTSASPSERPELDEPWSDEPTKGIIEEPDWKDFEKPLKGKPIEGEGPMWDHSPEKPSGESLEDLKTRGKF